MWNVGNHGSNSQQGAIMLIGVKSSHNPYLIYFFHTKSFSHYQI
jgi:hypothetical protein